MWLVNLTKLEHGPDRAFGFGLFGLPNYFRVLWLKPSSQSPPVDPFFFFFIILIALLECFTFILNAHFDSLPYYLTDQVRQSIPLNSKYI